ncbi:MAG: hypothetical protein JJT85_01225 [Chromatiales bacterium]|nr:hypothetical protein [Chromatiales bacterium]
MSTNETRLIRKYVNRRLYDTRQSRYVNLEDLRELVVQGIEIKVVEQATGTDITTPVMLQIIGEGAKGGAHLLKADFLSGLIRLAGRDDAHELKERLNQQLKAVLTSVAATPVAPRPVVTGSSSFQAAETAGFRPLNTQN